MRLIFAPRNKILQFLEVFMLTSRYDSFISKLSLQTGRGFAL